MIKNIVKNMSQSDVYKLLKKKDEWITTKEIVKKLNGNRRSICVNLNKMFKYKEVNKREVKVNNHREFAWRIV